MSIHPGIVYIVDDDEAFRDSIAWLLQTNGYQARLFADAESFLKEVKPGVGGPPRCAVMDVRMPLMDGISATQAIRRREKSAGTGSTPIIMLTANVLPEHIEQAKRAGANAHLAKPITAPALLQALEDALENATVPDDLTLAC